MGGACDIGGPTGTGIPDEDVDAVVRKCGDSNACGGMSGLCGMSEPSEPLAKASLASFNRCCKWACARASQGERDAIVFGSKWPWSR